MTWEYVEVSSGPRPKPDLNAGRGAGGLLISNLSGVGLLQPFVVLSLSTHLRRFAGPTRPQNRRGLGFDLLRSESDDASVWHQGPAGSRDCGSRFRRTSVRKVSAVLHNRTPLGLPLRCSRTLWSTWNRSIPISRKKLKYKIFNMQHSIS